MSKSASSRVSLSSPRELLAALLSFFMLAVGGGVFAAGFALPFVGAASVLTDASVQLFDELPSDFNVLQPSQISYLKGSDGQTIAQFYAENRIVVPLAKISKNARNAIVAVEDKRFYKHKGVDLSGMLRAVVTNAAGGSTQGASTLTQQYVKNVLIEAGLQASDPEAVEAARAATPARKLREAKYSLTLEKRYTKAQILEGYLNIAAFGPSTYGIEAASRHYFSHSADTLSVGEAALLAGMTNWPTRYDPITNPDAAKTRRDWVLQKMLEEKFITQEQYKEATSQSIDSMLKVTNAVGGCGSGSSGVTKSAAYFCEYVVREILTNDAYGKDEATRRQLLLRGGLQITTTLDMAKQQAAYDTMANWLPTGDESNVKGALVSIEPGTGKIITMVQNTNYGEPSNDDPTATKLSYAADSKHGGSNTGGFQPGSSFKPIVLAQWYQRGMSGYTVLGGASHVFTTGDFHASCDPGFAIENWNVDNANASENVNHTVINATALSVNVSYVYMLSRMDLCAVTAMAKDLGITTVDGGEIDHNPSMVLGTMNVAPITMANVYATFAAHGTYCPPTAITKVTKDDGTEIKVPSTACRQVMDPTHADQVALTLTYVMKGNGTGAAAALNRPSAGKTGTTEKMDNAWFVGFVPQLSTAVWVGHSEGNFHMDGQVIGGRYYSTMYGSDLPAPLWRDYMNSALSGTEVQQFNQVSLGGNSAVGNTGATPQGSTGNNNRNGNNNNNNGNNNNNNYNNNYNNGTGNNGTYNNSQGGNTTNNGLSADNSTGTPQDRRNSGNGQ